MICTTSLVKRWKRPLLLFLPFPLTFTAHTRIFFSFPCYPMAFLLLSANPPATLLFPNSARVFGGKLGFSFPSEARKGILDVHPRCFLCAKERGENYLQLPYASFISPPFSPPRGQRQQQLEKENFFPLPGDGG